MTLREFIDTYDREGVIVLLEGKRNVKEADQPKLKALGTLLASNTFHMTFRSGNAEGADQVFSEGVVMVDPKRLQVIVPYTGHRQKSNYAHETISLSDINVAADTELVYQSKSNKKPKNSLISLLQATETGMPSRQPILSGTPSRP